YGMATFEGPMLSLKKVNAISHFTDWTIAHVHVGALGWNGFLTFGILYWLIPKMFRVELYSKRLANVHFWIGTLGIVLYAVPMYWAGVMQSLMWKDFTPDGQLQWKFLETVTKMMPFYAARALGGTLYLIGAIVMVYNLVKTIKVGNFLADEPAEAPALAREYKAHSGDHWHRWIERKPVQMMVLSLVVVAIGGIIEFVPTFLVKSNIPTIASVKPYTPLELQGRDIYIREGCYTCHSQMVRPFRSETARYGEYSKAGEFVYDHPFQWGSKRTGPDLAREGVLNPSTGWHFLHLWDPRKVAEQSIMPRYVWLFNHEIDVESTPAKIRAMQTLGVPYEAGYDTKSIADLKEQAAKIAEQIKQDDQLKKLSMVEDNLDLKTIENKEVVALIAYLQRL
ncbi:MAG: cytochrome-c oxidase, cbb3-type subunit II, partial [Bacteroidetes bacterium]|nr:cytochrome-c oxidase, cbb3-type subunit II [Bacteroidota bacterium]